MPITIQRTTDRKSQVSYFHVAMQKHRFLTIGKINQMFDFSAGFYFLKIAPCVYFGCLPLGSTLNPLKIAK